jgi:hypothetical protein
MDHPAHPENPDMTDTTAIPDQLENPDITEPELLSTTRPAASSAPPAHLDPTDPTDLLDLLDQRDPRELQEPLEQEKVVPEPLELQATPDRRELMVQRDLLAHQALMEAGVVREHPAKRVQPDQLAVQANQVQQELTETMEVLDQLDQLDQQDHPAELAIPAHLAQLATLVPLAMMHSTAHAHHDRLSSAASAVVSASKRSLTHQSMNAYPIFSFSRSLSSV